METKTGVYEWANTSVNIQIGCEHNCRYCYARHRAVERFHYCKSNEAWKTPVIDYIRVNKAYRKNYGTVMFPSTHDITPLNINECLCVLRKIINAGNRVLIVSKPHRDCILAIMKSLQPYKHRFMFRFTIGSTNDEILKFWEPGATSFSERMECLKMAYQGGYKTSVSCEPYLDASPDITYDACRDYITDSFWIGKIRMLASRVRLDDVTPEQIKKYVEPLKAAQSDEIVKIIYQLLDGRPLVKWKDSIREVIGI